MFNRTVKYFHLFFSACRRHVPRFFLSSPLGHHHVHLCASRCSWIAVIKHPRSSSLPKKVDNITTMTKTTHWVYLDSQEGGSRDSLWYSQNWTPSMQSSSLGSADALSLEPKVQSSASCRVTLGRPKKTQPPALSLLLKLISKLHENCEELHCQYRQHCAKCYRLA